MTAAGIDTDNNQLKAAAEAATAEILVAMEMATTTVMVTAAASLPWLKFVRVGRWRKDGDE